MTLVGALLLRITTLGRRHGSLWCVTASFGYLFPIDKLFPFIPLNEDAISITDSEVLLFPQLTRAGFGLLRIASVLLGEFLVITLGPSA